MKILTREEAASLVLDLMKKIPESEKENMGWRMLTVAGGGEMDPKFVNTIADSLLTSDGKTVLAECVRVVDDDWLLTVGDNNSLNKFVEDLQVRGGRTIINRMD